MKFGRIVDPMRFGVASLAMALLSAGCGAEGGELDEPEPRPKVRACLPPEGFDGMPSTIEEVVELINALPKPVTVPCLLSSFDRPLEVNATSNTFSAQPAFGPNNPRIFIYREDLLISVVTKGEGRPLVEFGLMRSPTKSLKGELAFPIEEEITPAAPYERITAEAVIGNSGSKCGFCHLNESLDPDIDFADGYVSDLISPPPSTVVDLDYLLWAYDNCNPETEADRCAMFDSIFAFGDVTYRPLP